MVYGPVRQLKRRSDSLPARLCRRVAASSFSTASFTDAKRQVGGLGACWESTLIGRMAAAARRLAAVLNQSLANR